MNPEFCDSLLTFSRIMVKALCYRLDVSGPPQADGLEQVPQPPILFGEVIERQGRGAFLPKLGHGHEGWAFENEGQGMRFLKGKQTGGSRYIVKMSNFWLLPPLLMNFF